MSTTTERPISDKKQKPTQQLTAERATLAHAIAAQAERIGRLDALDQAVRRATSAVHAACSVVDEAVEQEAQKARMHGRSPDPGAVTDDAKRVVEVTRAARDAAKAELAAEKAQHDPWPQRIDAAAQAVLRAELAGDADARAARVERLQRELFKEGSVLSWEVGRGVIRPAPPATEDKTAIDETIYRFESCAPAGWGKSWNVRSPFPVSTDVLALEAWFKALQRDANAPMPEVDADGG